MSTRDACPAPCVVADRCPLAALIRQLHSAVSGSNLPPVPCGPIPADRRIGPPLPVSGVVDPEDNPVTTSHLSKPASTTAPPELPPAETLSTRAEFDAPSADPAALTVVRSRHPWRWVAAIAVLVARRAVRQRAGHQPRLGLADVRPVLHRTGGAAGAVADHPADRLRNGARLRPRHRRWPPCRLSKNPVLQTVSWTYVWAFRSIPLIVQLLFWFNIAYLYQTLSHRHPVRADLRSRSTSTPRSAG